MKDTTTVINDTIYQRINKNIIGIQSSLHEASFGAISRSSGAAIQKLLKVDRFIGIAYLIEGELYGTSLLGMRKDQADPPMEILENFIHLSALFIRRKRAEIELTYSYEKLRLLTQHIEEVRENERIAISRELHDDLGQSLTAVKMDLSSIKHSVTDNEVLSKIIKVTELVSDTIKTVQRLTAQLRPQIIEDLGLEAAIQWYTKDFAKRSEIEINLNIASKIDISPDISLVVFRIIQESLTNVARHAAASHVEIKLRKTNNQLKLQITDNGIGISEKNLKAKDSFGLISMTERAASLGGELHIGKGNECGTILQLLLPLNLK